MIAAQSSLSNPASFFPTESQSSEGHTKAVCTVFICLSWILHQDHISYLSSCCLNGSSTWEDTRCGNALPLRALRKTKPLESVWSYNSPKRHPALSCVLCPKLALRHCPSSQFPSFRSSRTLHITLIIGTLLIPISSAATPSRTSSPFKTSPKASPL